RSETRMSFNKGYTPEGYAERVFHIHFHPAGDRDEILFRDYLLSHPATAKEYEKLKQNLLPAFRHDRDGYTAAKTDFINKVLALARKS
ncbi:MAG: GrpB family protein, partial [Muribaculaceae bacterium]|nr:GrpB family protein [Muribaculaceae bacterium]